MNGWMIDEAMLVRVLYDADFFKWVLMGMWRRGLWRWSPMFLPLLDATTSSIVIVEGVKVGGHDIRTQHKIHTHYIYIYIYAVYRMTEHSMTIYEMTEGSDLTLSCGGALVFFFIDASRQGTWGTGSMCYSSGPGSYLYSVTSMQRLWTFVMQSGKGEIPQLYPPAWTEPSCSKVRGRYPSCTFLDG